METPEFNFMDRKLRFAIYASRFPILVSYVMQGPPSYRTRRFSSLVYGACETVLTAKKLGGFLQSGGTIDPDLFSEDPLQNQKTPNHIDVTLSISEEVTPFLYREIDGLNDDDARDVICSLFEVYLLTLGATKKGGVVADEPEANSKISQSTVQPSKRMRTARTANTASDADAVVNEESASSFTKNKGTEKTTVTDAPHDDPHQHASEVVKPPKAESDTSTKRQRPSFRVKKRTLSSEQSSKPTDANDEQKTNQDEDTLALLKVGNVDI